MCSRRIFGIFAIVTLSSNDLPRDEVAQFLYQHG